MKLSMLISEPDQDMVELNKMNLNSGYPNWNINHNDYEYFLTVTGLIIIQNSTNSSDVLAAFVGNECRGVASATLTSEGWLWFLMVRANVDDETVTFRIWDADQNTVLCVSNEIVFISGNAYGTINTPYLLEINPPMLMFQSNDN